MRAVYFGCLVLVLGCGSNATGDDGDSTTGGQGHSGGQGGSASGGAAAGSSNAGTGGVAGSGGTPSGAGSSAGGSNGGSTTSGGSGGSGGSEPEPEVLPCDELSEIGEWEDITPPGVEFVQDFVLDPQHSGTLYVGGGQGYGIWKTTNCGADWIKVNTGLLASEMDGGGHWTMAIDHVDPNVLWTSIGYGLSGVFKSTNGGTDWTQTLTGDAATAFIYGGFVERITVDPTDHLHLLVSPHFSCENGHEHCFLETTDGGDSWVVLDDQPPVAEDSGQVMIDSQTWLFGTWDGLWRTSDGGDSWDMLDYGGVGDGIYQGPDGTYYMISISTGVLKSTDTITWEVIPNSPHNRALAGDGTSLFASNRNEGTPFQPYSSASLDDLDTWTTYPSPDRPRGGWVMHYDDGHGVLYSSTENQGFWRVKTK